MTNVVFITAGGSGCPLELNPPSFVAKHAGPVSVNCTVTTEADGIGWKASEGGTGNVQGVKSVIWEVENLTDWETRPRCFRNFKSGHCDKPLDIVIYPKSLLCFSHSLVLGGVRNILELVHQDGGQ